MINALVGRESDRAALGAWLAEAVAGAPRVVLVSGDAGAGRTRLLEDLLAVASEPGAATGFGRSVEREGAPPFWPWRCLLDELGAPDLLGATDSTDPSAERFLRFDTISSWIGDAAAAAAGLVVAVDDLHLGKTTEQAASEVKATRERLGLVREEVRKIFGEYIPGDWMADSVGKSAIVLREPVGTVAAFGPFNYPLYSIRNPKE